jgi:hypothetical protein
MYMVTAASTQATNTSGAFVTFSGTAVSATAHMFHITPQSGPIFIVAGHATARIIRLGAEDVRVSFMPVLQD